MVVLAEELVALAVDPLLLAVRLPARKSSSESGGGAAKFDSCAAVCSVPKLVPGLTWCACLFERHQASSSCVAKAARWCAARVRAFRRRRSRLSLAAPRSSVAPRRRAAVAVVATIVAARRHARERRISGGQQDLWDCCERPQRPGQPLETRTARSGSCFDDGFVCTITKSPSKPKRRQPNTSVRDTLV